MSNANSCLTNIRAWSRSLRKCPRPAREKSIGRRSSTAQPFQSRQPCQSRLGRPFSAHRDRPRRRAGGERANARWCSMKAPRAKNLQLAGIELVLPTVLCIEGRQINRARPTVTVGYAAGYVDSIVASVVAEWLSRHFHGRFSEHGRGPEGDLAAEAFYDKLARNVGTEAPFLTAIVSVPEPGMTRSLPPLHSAPKPHSGGHRNGNGDLLSRFTNGAGLARWAFAGPIHAFINAKTGAAQ